MLIGFAICLSIVSIIISHRLKTDHDTFFLIKVVGYYTLSITAITINTSYPIPIGFFIAYILADSTNFNRRPKKLSTILGLFNYIICVTSYYIFYN